MLTTHLIPVSRLKIGGAIALLFHCYQGFRKDKFNFTCELLCGLVIYILQFRGLHGPFKTK